MKNLIKHNMIKRQIEISSEGQNEKKKKKMLRNVKILPAAGGEVIPFSVVPAISFKDLR